jgi:hypothetical protein
MAKDQEYISQLIVNYDQGIQDFLRMSEDIQKALTEAVNRRREVMIEVAFGKKPTLAKTVKEGVGLDIDQITSRVLTIIENNKEAIAREAIPSIMSNRVIRADILTAIRETITIPPQRRSRTMPSSGATTSHPQGISTQTRNEGSTPSTQRREIATQTEGGTSTTGTQTDFFLLVDMAVM